MEKTEKLIQRSEELLRNLAEMQDAILKLNEELRVHTEELNQNLVRLRKKAGASPLTTAERRSTPRRDGNPTPVHINRKHGDDSQAPIQGWVVDRSPGGLRLLVDEAIAPGTILNVRPVKIHEAFPWLEVKVRSCYPERKSWNLGCQFVEELCGNELQHFG